MNTIESIVKEMREAGKPEKEIAERVDQFFRMRKIYVNSVENRSEAFDITLLK